jgi:hypothetical protein
MPQKSDVYDVGFVGKIDFSWLLKIFGFLEVGLSKASAINGRATIFIGFGKIPSLFELQVLRRKIINLRRRRSIKDVSSD